MNRTTYISQTAFIDLPSAACTHSSTVGGGMHQGRVMQCRVERTCRCQYGLLTASEEEKSIVIRSTCSARCPTGGKKSTSFNTTNLIRAVVDQTTS